MNYSKIEIIINQRSLSDLVMTLGDIQVTGYTVIDVIAGKGIKQGTQVSDELFLASNQVMLFTIVDDELAETIIRHIQPFLDVNKGVMIMYSITYGSGLNHKNS